MMRLPAAAILALACVASPAAARDGRRLFLSADMEGIAGVVTGEQLGPRGFEYARFRELMTEEVNAAIAAAREAGASEFVVADSHGNGQNLLVEKLPPDVTLVRAFPRPLGMMPGVRRADAHEVRFTARDMPEVARLLSIVTQYQPSLEP